MCHKKIRIPRENANEIMRALGSLKNAIEFEDLTKGDIEAKKNFGEMIKRCDEVKKKIYDYNRICYDFNFPFEYYSTFEEFTKDLKLDMGNRDKILGSTYFDLVENEIMENDRKINELIDSHTQIREDLVNLIEKKHVLLKGEQLVKSGETSMHLGMGTNLNFILGVVPYEYEMKMKRMIFRISRGRAISTFYSLEINNDEFLLTSTLRQRRKTLIENENKNLQKLSALIQSKDVGNINTKRKIFTIFFTGSDENILLERLLRVCEIFQASRYQIPKDSNTKDELKKIKNEIRDKKNVMLSIEKNLKEFCLITNSFEGKYGYKYSLYKLFFEQEKVIYTTLNKCIIRETFVDGSVWIPKKEVDKVAVILQNLFRGNKENKTSAYLEDILFEEDIHPPTFIEINEFTAAFQEVVNTYGIPRYREINPGYFTIITFPFLFGVMFGDIGHGLILLIFAIYLCLFNNKIKKSKSIFKSMLFARYFLLLMGFFAVYCGSLYNDFLSIPIDIGTCYNLTDKDKYINTITRKKDNCNYNYGLDPIWYITNNELQFVNSLKMKLSVILGVFQMTLGIILKGFNAIFERDCVEFIFVFFPQLILMLLLFGYMDFLIFAKWATNYDIKNVEYYNEDLIKNETAPFDFSYYAPDIKSYLMNIFLRFGKLPEDPPNATYNSFPIKSLENHEWILLTNRKTLEKIHFGIFIGSIFCIIIMLFPKIILNYSKAKKKYLKYNNNQNNINNDEINNENQPFKEGFLPPQKEVEPPLITNFIVECAIETIEFVLGTVSNTASYLRLWALSLAHSQLAVVFFSKLVTLMGNYFNYWYINGLLLVIIFPIFAGVTAIVLLFMDMMECFLHTLRLHWVEFQNKFYKADGYEFRPFCFSAIIVLNEEEFSD